MLTKIIDYKKSVIQTALIARKRGIKHAINYMMVQISDKLKLSHFYGQPRYAQIETTTCCNSKCFMCHRSSNKWKHMRFETFKKIISKLPYCTRVELHGIGEPLLNPDLVRMVKFCKKKKMLTAFTTNAITLSEELGKKLILARLDSISISIDSANSKTFRMMRGCGFHTVIKNVKRFVQLKKELESETPNVSVKVRVSKENIYEIPELIELVSGIGIKQVFLVGLIRSDNKNLSRKQLNLIPKYQDYGKSLGIYISQYFNGLPPYTGKKMVLCSRFWKGMYITINGWATPCCRSNSEKIATFGSNSEKIATFGNVLKQNLDEVWN